ncbi:MAG: sulfate reduction electron transfer complex DsrMKJOP subunit DsrJ [Desulfobacterales bacterium]|nr:sulfate reduction electron transfer complex DsrMKJOP subunit DsrJ [Desulfobacterales bacterium]MBF0396266.1 sulfate reduction electron transfer complex DsrMKJOP subunit DsrJ [Desulfobacterales bacterium]
MPNNNNKIYDKNKIVIGIVIFLIISLFPIWYNHFKNVPAPDPLLTEKAKIAKECVLPKVLMKTEHMQLLNSWRDSVVRDGKRLYTNSQGKVFDMSLSNGCLDCHSNKKDFCDRCHNYASVRPYCFDCHIDNPKEKK